jgi:hypothetical protein
MGLNPGLHAGTLPLEPYLQPWYMINYKQIFSLLLQSQEIDNLSLSCKQNLLRKPCQVLWLTAVNSSCWGSRDQKDHGLRPVWKSIKSWAWWHASVTLARQEV